MIKSLLNEMFTMTRGLLKGLFMVFLFFVIYGSAFKYFDPGKKSTNPQIRHSLGYFDGIDGARTH